MEDVIISARGIGYQIGTRFLLRNINWDIERNSRWIIIGMNGSGKTTLLSILAGYRSYNHGELLYEGVPYPEQNIFDIRRKMGWISSSFFDQVYHDEAILDVLLAGCSGTYGAMEEKRVSKAKQLLKSVGLEGREDAPFSWLSKGEKQAVLIARALLVEPEVLVFDEPMTGLDVLARESMRRFVKLAAAKHQHTLLYVTHHFDEISPDLFDQCMLLKHGRIYRKGPIETMFTSSTISAFLDVPTTVRLDEDGFYALSFKV